MNNIYFFKERKTSHSSFKKTLIHSVSQKLLLISFLALSIFSVKSQTAPNISYATPQNYLLNAAITTLAPVNSGGSVPALNYKQVSTFAGTTAGWEDGTGTAAKMNGPIGMTMDTDGNVYFVDNTNHRIRKMTPAGVVTTIAGDGALKILSVYGQFKDNAIGTTASFSFPTGLVFDAANNCLYVADQFNYRIRKISLTGTYAVTTFAGSGTSTSVDGTGTAAAFKTPYGIAIDPSGTYLYVVDETGNKIRRVTISNAQVVTVAGSGTAGTVDNTTGTLATFNDPKGIAVDANAIYVSDFGGNKIRKIALTAPYAVTTFAGSGVASSVDGTGVAATFKTPFGITLDGAGNLYVTEWGNKIRKITPAGIATTIAGSGISSSLDGNGIAATFNDPSGIIINPTTGIAYVSEYAGDRIRKIELGGYDVSPILPAGLSLNSSTGGISGTPTTINNGPLNYSISAYNYYGSSTATVALTTANVPTLTTTAASALTQTTATTGGNVTATGGSILLEKGICWSTSANPTILDTKVVEGTTTTGSYTAAITGLVASTTYYIRAYATSSVGTAYGTQVSFTTLITPPTISFTASNTFTVNTPITTLTVSNTGGTVNGLSITNVSTLAGSTQGYANGTGTAAQFNSPNYVASDVLGTIYVSDSSNHMIRKITPAGLVSTFAGDGSAGNLDGQGVSAQFKFPNGIATDRLGNIFVADFGGIRKINATGNVTTLSYQFSSISLGISRGIVVDNSGIIYFSDNKHRIYKIDTSNNLTVLAGGDNITGTDDGIGTSARFYFPNGLAVDAIGNVYVADTYNNRIRKITPSGVVTTLAGSTQGFNDGTGASAQFNNPAGITVDATGTLYVGEMSNNRIRKITSMGVVTTIAGIASPGNVDGNATLASFTSPRGVTSDSDGNLYVADYNNHRIRKIAMGQGFSISPALPAGLVLNANGSISGTPTVATDAATYTVTATNAGGSSSFPVSIATLALPVITTTAARSITATALTTGGTVTSAASSVTAAGMCYSTSPLPTLLDTFTTDVLNEGSFTKTIGNLTASTTYYIRAYATNNLGTSYGNQIVINTPMYAPIIGYSSPSPFIVNTPITALEVSNIGGAIPTQLYGVSTVAGGNEPGSADGALGTALFSNPTAVVKDSQGNLFVADYNNHGIRKIAPNGIVSFYAGGSGPGSADGPRANSSFKNPFGLAIDHLDNLYVSEPLAHTVRKITASGIVSTFAGTSGALNSDNLSFNTPRGLTCDAAGNVYVIDSGNNRIQKITPNGITSTFFSGGDVQISYNMVFDSVGNLWLATESTQGGLKKIDTNGVVTSTLFGNTTKSIAIDQSDNIYVADQFAVIKKITPSYAISNINSLSFGFVDGDFAVAKFKGISGLYLDKEGLLYVADTDNNRIRMVSHFGYSVTPALPAGLVLNTDGSITGSPIAATAPANYTIKGTNSGGSYSTTLNFAIATIPTLTTTAASAVIATSATAGGNITSDGYASVTARGVCWSTTSNPTIADAKTTNGTETGTFYSSITGLSPVTTYYIRAYATNSVGTVYGNEIVVNTPMYAPAISYSSPNAFVVDTPITALEVSNSGGATTSTIDGDTPAVVSTFAGICGTSGATNGQGTAAFFNSPNAVAVDANNNLYVSDLGNSKIRKITTTGIVSDFVTVTSPQGIAVDTNGNVYVNTANEIRKYIQNGTFTILAASTNFTSAKGLAVDTNGNVYVADFGASKIMKISPSGVISTLAGSGDWGGADGLAANATFFTPVAVAVDASGTIYVADYDAARIRKITTDGIVSTLAGSTWGFQNGTGSEARFDSLAGIAVDAFGNVYVTDYYNYAIRKITPQGVVTTLTGFSAGSCTDGSLNQAKFGSPTGLTIDASGSLYVSDSSSNTIRKITLNPYSVAPALPAGLALNPDGSITGTPTVATAAADYVVTATNSGGNSSKTLNFAITTVPSLTTTEASAITAITATLGGNVTSDGYASVTERGVCWSTSSNPTIADAKTTDATGTGTFTSSITGLSPVTAYYVRAYATNSVGTVYGNEIVVITPMYAPVISYSSPNAFVVNTPITALEVNSIGGAVPLPNVTILAGTNGVTGSTDDTGSGASFNSPHQMATDLEGTIYLADKSNHRIRKITALGVVTTLAGSTQGDQDGNGVNANFDSPIGVAVDALGNVYVADSGNHKIKKITSAGDVTTIAGSFQGFLDGTGINTKFDTPKSLILDASGNLYVADSYNHKIRKITPAGVVTTFAGSSSGYQEGNGTSSQFYFPSGLTRDAMGNFYAADGLNHKIRKITPSADVTTLAGSASGILDGTGTAAKFNNPQGISIDAVGNIYVPDFNNQQIRKVTPNGVVTTIAGSAFGNILGQSIDGSILSARFADPIGIAVGLNGIVYVSDRASNVIRKMELAGFLVSPVLPTGLVLNADGSITGTPTVATAATDYIVTATNSGGSSSYTLNFAITTIPSLTTTEASAITATSASLGGTITTDGYASVSARGVCWSTSPNPTTANSVTTDGTGTGIFVSAITGLSPVTAYYVRAYATNSVGTVYGNEFSFTTVLPLPVIQYTAVATYNVNTAITPLTVTNTGGVVINSLAGVSTFAGSDAGYTDGTTNAQFSQPSGVVTDSNGNLFVADSSNNAIRKITPSGTVSTFAGGTLGTADGLGTASQFSRPNSIAIDANDNLYVSDTGNQLIRKITPSGLVSTLAGTAGTAGFLDGTGTSAQFNTPYGLTLDVSGNVYVADNANNRIRKITPAGVVSTYFVLDHMLRTLDSPLAVAFDSAGNLFVSQFSSNGLVKILVTDSFSELTIVDNNGPVGTITFDTNNSIYAGIGGAIIKLQEPYTSGTLFAGGSQGFADGALLEAKFGGIRGLTIDNEGVMYVADGVNNRIRKISPFGYLVSPALPTGLTLNANGSITGTPTLTTAATDYVVTATNSGGSASYTINFAITETAVTPTWTGTEWINGPVSTTKQAIIEGNYTPSSSFEVGELTIKNNALVSIRSGVNLTVNGKLTVEPGSDLTFESNANLLQTTDVANSGAISIKRNTAPLKLLDYVLWSSPLTGQQLQSYSTLTLSNRFYTYNSGTNIYNAVVNPTADTFTAGIGYLIRMPNNHPTTPTIWTGTFTGIPTNGTVNLAVTNGTYNAIGNPYPSTLNADAFIDANSITEALYFWRKTNNSTNPSYATYTKAGGVGTANSADPLGLIPNGIIQVGQGFIAKTTSAAISFTNAMRNANNGNIFLRTKNTEKSRIWLNLTNDSGFFSQALVAYMDGASSGIDAAIDGRYFNDSKTALTSIINDEEFSIQGRSLPFDANDIVPLGFKTETAGDFTLAIDHTDGLFATEQKVFLKDNLTNTVNDLSTGTFKFTTEAGVFNNRFALVYQKTLGTNNADVMFNQVLVYKQNDKIRIDAGALVIAVVKVYDLNGRLLFERKNINANQAVLSVMAAQETLLIKITSNDGIVITKKLIN